MATGAITPIYDPVSAGNFGLPNFGFSFSGENLGIPTNSPRTPSNASSWAGLLGALGGDALKGWEFNTQANLLNEQIRAGQTPSIGFGSYGLTPLGASGAFGSGFIWLLVAAVLLIVLLKR